MISYSSRPVVAVALLVVVVWRAAVIRRRGWSRRELPVAAMSLWAIAVAAITFFPLVIIFYDWHGTANWVPLASIRQILANASGRYALENIGGNIVMFVPFGFLLPILFRRAQPLPGTLWRGAAVSATIELSQHLSRARALDVDDVLLNTLGAGLGWLAYRALSGRRRSQLDAVAHPTRHPLRSATVPVVVTALLALVLIGAEIAGATMSFDEARADAVAAAGANGQVVLEDDVTDQHLVVASGDAGMVLSGYQRVVPGRVSWLSRSNVIPPRPGMFEVYYTAFRPDLGQVPHAIVWGLGGEGALAVHITADRLDVTLPVPATGPFVVSTPFEPDAMPSLRIELVDAGGRSVGTSA